MRMFNHWPRFILFSCGLLQNGGVLCGSDYGAERCSHKDCSDYVERCSRSTGAKCTVQSDCNYHPRCHIGVETSTTTSPRSYVEAEEMALQESDSMPLAGPLQMREKASVSSDTTCPEKPYMVDCIDGECQCERTACATGGKEVEGGNMLDPTDPHWDMCEDEFEFKSGAQHGDWAGQWFDVEGDVEGGRSWSAPKMVCKKKASLEKGCKATWKQHRDFCYRLLEAMESYEGAAEVCKDFGGMPASIHDRGENEAVRQICGRDMCWIGLSRPEEDEDAWAWADGSPLVYTNWHHGEPNNSGGHEEYVIMNINGDWVGAQIFKFLIVFCIVITGSFCLTSGCALSVAHYHRGPMLERTKQGEFVHPPNGFWRWCCGGSAVYYWEGCSCPCWLACCCCNSCGAALCCWQPGPSPKQHGLPVGPAVQAPGVGASQVHVIGQPVIGTACMAQYGGPQSLPPGVVMATPVLAQPEAQAQPVTSGPLLGSGTVS